MTPHAYLILLFICTWIAIIILAHAGKQLADALLKTLKILKKHFDDEKSV